MKTLTLAILLCAGVALSQLNIGNPFFVAGVLKPAAAGGGGGTLEFDAATTASAVVDTSITFSHTCSGSDRILFVGISQNGSANITGVTYNGVAMTNCGTELFFGSLGSAGYILGNPASGANNIVVSFSATTTATAGAVSFTGGDTASPNRTPVTAENSGTGPDATTTVTASGATTGDIVIDCATVNQTATAVGALQTSRAEADNYAGSGHSMGISTQAGADGGVMTWTHGSGYFFTGAVAIRPKP